MKRRPSNDTTAPAPDLLASGSPSVPDTQTKPEVHADWSLRIGIPRPNVNYWGCERDVGGGKWERLYTVAPDGSRVCEWTLDELTLDVVRRRWGSGKFRARWYQVDSSQVKAVGAGRSFVLERVDVAPLEDEDDAPAAAPAPAMPVLPEGFAQLGALMAFADARGEVARTQASDQLNSIITVARELGGNRGMDPAMVQLLMGQQQQTQALAATLEALRTSGAEQTRLLREELAAVRRELADDDEEESTLSNVAKAAAPAFRSGKPAGEQIKAAALNFLFENPTAILDILKPIVAPIAQAVVASMAKAPAPEPAQQVIAAPALVEAKPRPVAVARPKAAAPSSGINELFAKADGPKLDAQQIRANAEAEVERARVAAAEVVEVVNGAASAE